jgi:plastocyanin
MRLVAVIAFVAACSKPAPQTYQVDIRAMQFTPDVVHAGKGDHIVWTNHDLVPHTVTAPGKFDSGPLQPGQQWTYTVPDAQEYDYACTMHPTMHGQLLAP